MGFYDGLKDAAAVLKEANKIPEYREILDAMEKMLEMQKRIADLEAQNKDLLAKLETKGRLSYDRSTYWLAKEDGTTEGPFCSRCWDVEKKLVRTHSRGNPDVHQCPECKNVVQLKNNPRSQFRQPPYESPSSFSDR